MLCRQKRGGTLALARALSLALVREDIDVAFENASESERLAIEAAGLRKPFKLKELPKPKGPGHDWKLDALVKFAEPKLQGRDFKNGQKMFAAARCIVRLPSGRQIGAASAISDLRMMSVCSA